MTNDAELDRLMMEYNLAYQRKHDAYQAQQHARDAWQTCDVRLCAVYEAECVLADAEVKRALSDYDSCLTAFRSRLKEVRLGG